jgi:hypothetical protein
MEVPGVDRPSAARNSRERLCGGKMMREFGGESRREALATRVLDAPARRPERSEEQP